MDDDVYFCNMKKLLLGTIHIPICLGTEAWFDSISVTDQVETLYAYLSKHRSLVWFDPGHRPSGNLISYLFKDRSLVWFGSVRFDPRHRASGKFIFLFVQGQKLGLVRSPSSTKWKPYIPICLRAEAWFSSIPLTDQVETLHSYFN